MDKIEKYMQRVGTEYQHLNHSLQSLCSFRYANEFEMRARRPDTLDEKRKLLIRNMKLAKCNAMKTRMIQAAPAVS
ncbi:hypothetical protein MKZ38_008511 [Zalerion maritima]|uniref:Uncharacterized protein n=1 Tax=Zalerion maritima TaxID=339359 RepID=A0AAD5RGM9_9PEZI|nr:hypothetical protein MKZ38_008511 [Zalerion maritima]